MTQMVFWKNPAEQSDEPGEAWQWAVTGRRIPREASYAVTEAANIVAQANAILQQATAEADAIRQQGFAEGMRASEDCIAEVLAEALLISQNKVARYLQLAEPRIVQLVFAVVRRLLPELPLDQVINSLVTEVLGSIHGKNRVRVYVNPALETSVQALVPGWLALVPDVGNLEVSTDGDLDITSCRVETEFGAVSAGLQDRFNKIVQSYEVALKKQSGAEPDA